MKSIIIFMTEEQIKNVLAAIDAAEKWELTTGKKVMALHVNSEFFKTLKELVADRLDYSKHFPFNEKPCEDCISREVVLDIIKEVCFSKEQKWVDFRVSHGSNGQRDLIINYIESLPPVTLKQRTGKWVKYAAPRCGEQHYKCTNCDDYVNFGQYGDYYMKDFKFCPHCGAKMEGEEDG